MQTKVLLASMQHLFQTTVNAGKIVPPFECESMTNKNVATCLFFMMEDFFSHAMSVRLDETTESWRVSQISFHVRMFMSFGHDLGFIWNPWVHGPCDSGVVPLRNCAPAWAEGPVF